MKSLRLGMLQRPLGMLGRPWQRLAGAASASFLGHLVTTILALVPTYPMVLALASTVDDDPRGEAALLEPGGAVLLESLDQAGGALFALANATLVVQVVALLLSPFLALTWLAALARPRPLAASIAEGARGYVRAVGAALFLLIPGGVAVGLAIAIPSIIHLLLRDTPDARVHDTLVFVGMLVGLAPLAIVAAWHDLARAAIVRGARTSWRAVIEGAIALRGGAVPAYVGWLTVGLALLALGHAIGVWLASPSLGMAVLVLVLQQVIALARTLVRGRWLATAVEHAATVQPSTSLPPPSLRPVIPEPARTPADAETLPPPEPKPERHDPSVPIPLERPSRPGGIEPE